MAKVIPNLRRYPDHPKDLLQAWDGADELMLDQVAALDLSGLNVLILNDGFGALSSTLSLRDDTGLKLTSYTDSYVSAEGIRLNSEGAVLPISDLALLPGELDLVLLKIPKNLSFFEDELCQLSQRLKPGAKLICGAMIKHLPKSAFDLIQKYIGQTSTSLAAKKARLIFASFEKSAVTSPFPVRVKIESFAKPFLHHSNLFSREKLDIGTRFFLTEIPSGNFQTVLDMGCANGIVGIAAKQANPQAEIIFTDDSQMAVQSARANYSALFQDEARFIWTNCHERGEARSLDLVLCNPPFHQHQTVGDFIAKQMFQDAHRTLRTGGLLRIIGNSHLGYELQLKKLFGKSSLIAKNSKFVVIDAIKTA